MTSYCQHGALIDLVNVLDRPILGSYRLQSWIIQDEAVSDMCRRPGKCTAFMFAVGYQDQSTDNIGGEQGRQVDGDALMGRRVAISRAVSVRGGGTGIQATVSLVEEPLDLTECFRTVWPVEPPTEFGRS